MSAVPRTSDNRLASIGATPSRALLTADEVGELLQVRTAWVYAQSRAERIPHIRLGRYVRFRRDAIEQWLARIEAGEDRSAR